MMEKFQPPKPYQAGDDRDGPRFLQPQQVQMIEEALHSLGDYGEVRLVVEKGRLRFLVIQQSFDMLKWQPGTWIKEL